MSESREQRIAELERRIADLKARLRVAELERRIIDLKARLRVAELERRIIDLKARLPRHSVPPAMIIELEELEEELERARRTSDRNSPDQDG